MAGDAILLTGDTLIAALDHGAAARPTASVRFPETQAELTLADLRRASVGRAHGLLADGLRPGEVVGLLASTGPDFLIDLFAIMRAGAAASVLPTPLGFSSEAPVVRHLSRVAQAARMRHLLTDSAMGPLAVQVRRHCPGLRILTGRELGGAANQLPRVRGDDLAVVQYTSGSTAFPRGVTLPHSTALAGLRAILVSAAFTPEDVLVQWVPHYHDMGLFGLLSQVLNGAHAHVFGPMAYVRRPTQVLRYFAQRRATVCTGPNFGYELLLRALSPELVSGLDLSRWRLAFNGAEPVSAELVERFHKLLAPAGVRPSVMYPVFGMAEATLAITFPAPDAARATIHVDRATLTPGRVPRTISSPAAGTSALVGLGTPVHGMELRVTHEDLPAPNGSFGEVEVRGPAVTPGYYRDPAATATAMNGTWLRTGDLGFTRGGDLFIVGRSKEMAVIRGRNYFPQDAERAAQDVTGVYRGHCVAFADTDEHDGAPFLGVIVETNQPSPAHADLAQAVRAEVVEELGLSDVRVHVAPPNWLTRTTSGKWQRLLARERLRGELVPDHCPPSP